MRSGRGATAATPAASAAAPSLDAALGEALTRIASRLQDLRLLVGLHLGGAAWFEQVWPDRTILIGPVATRTAVAEGIIAAGGQAVVLLDGGGAALPPRVGGCVAVAADREDVSAAYRAGVDVCQPSAADDVEPLLDAALRHDGPVVLSLHGPGLPPDAHREAVAFGEHRVLSRGGAGMVLGSGPTVDAARRMAVAMSAEEQAITALEVHTVTASSGVDATLLLDHVLVGPLHVERAAALTAVAVADDATMLPAVRAAMGR